MCYSLYADVLKYQVVFCLMEGDCYMESIIFGLIANLLWSCLLLIFRHWQKLDPMRKGYLTIKLIFIAELCIGICVLGFSRRFTSNTPALIISSIAAGSSFFTVTYIFFSFVNVTKRLENASENRTENSHD